MKNKTSLNTVRIILLAIFIAIIIYRVVTTSLQGEIALAITLTTVLGIIAVLLVLALGSTKRLKNQLINVRSSHEIAFYVTAESSGKLLVLAKRENEIILYDASKIEDIVATFDSSEFSVIEAGMVNNSAGTRQFKGLAIMNKSTKNLKKFLIITDTPNMVSYTPLSGERVSHVVAQFYENR